MQRTTQKLLYDALKACWAIQQFIPARTFEEYEGDLLLRSAIERQLIGLGEALNQARHIDEDIVSLLPDLFGIIALRNRLIHGYDTVDNALIW